MKTTKEKLEKKPAFEPAFQPRASQDGTYKPGKDLKATIDAAITATVRKHFGKVVPVIGTLGCRYHAPYKLGQPHLRFLLDNGHTVFASLASGVITVRQASSQVLLHCPRVQQTAGEQDRARRRQASESKCRSGEGCSGGEEGRQGVQVMAADRG